MQIKVIKTESKAIEHLRTQFLKEIDFQVRYHACHERGWSDSYLLSANDTEIGYASVKGKEKLADRDAVFECYTLPGFREVASTIFPELLKTSGATFVECQSNDLFLASMLYEFTQNIYADIFLFADHELTQLKAPGVIFRPRTEDDKIFEHSIEPVGEYVLEKNGEIVATGGFMLHYNTPFADLYMEVKKDQWKKGLGSFLIQEVKKECYKAGRVPAARCPMDNTGSKNTLLKAGLKISGFMLTGEIRNKLNSERTL